MHEAKRVFTDPMDAGVALCFYRTDACHHVFIKPIHASTQTAPYFYRTDSCQHSRDTVFLQNRFMPALRQHHVFTEPIHASTQTAPCFYRTDSCQHSETLCFYRTDSSQHSETRCFFRTDSCQHSETPCFYRTDSSQHSETPCFYRTDACSTQAPWDGFFPVPLIDKRRGLSPGGRFPPSFIHQVIIITGLNKLYNCMFSP